MKRIREIKSKSRSFSKIFVAHALNKDLEYRLDFAHYVKSIASEELTRAIWKNYYENLQTIIADKRKLREEKLARLDSIAKSPERTPSDASEALKLQREIDRLTKQLEGNISFWRQDYDNLSDDYLRSFANEVGVSSLRHIDTNDLLIAGASHVAQGSPAEGLNVPPPPPCLG